MHYFVKSRCNIWSSWWDCLVEWRSIICSNLGALLVKSKFTAWSRWEYYWLSCYPLLAESRSIAWLSRVALFGWVKIYCLVESRCTIWSSQYALFVNRVKEYYRSSWDPLLVKSSSTIWWSRDLLLGRVEEYLLVELRRNIWSSWGALFG